VRSRPVAIGVLFLSLALFAGLAFAQAGGQIVGVAQDASGAVVPSAAVTAVNQQTGLEFNATTDPAGRFSFPQLPVGDYRVRVARQGFETFTSEPFRLDADQTRELQARLDVKGTTQSVNVSGQVSEVETVSGVIREVVDRKRISELPLNGRNPVELVLLVPGVVTGPAASSLSQNNGIAVNGARATSTNYMLDGGDNNDPEEGVASVTPNPDMLEEFSVLTNNFNAEYGRSDGAVVNAVTKSGTNQFHGSAYEFLRNDTLDARNFFALTNGKLRRNQYGGTVGGPVFKNRTFFFFGYEGLKQRQGGTVSGLFVPTALERAGNFSASKQLPRDPATNLPFPGGIIPAGRLDPASQKFLTMLDVPLPNSPGGQFIYNSPQNSDASQYVGRLDHSFSASKRVSGRIFRSLNNQFITAGLPSLHSSTEFDTWNGSAQFTWVIQPRLMAIAQYTYSQPLINRGPLPAGGGEGVSYQSMGVKVNKGGNEALGVPLVTQYRGGVTGYWNLNQDNLVLINRPIHQGSYVLSYTPGRHLFKFGVEYRWSKSDRVTANQVDPQFSFSGQFTGNAMADFVLGLPLNFTQGSVRVDYVRAQAWTAFAQDEWKIGRDFSLSLGVRWEPFLPFTAGNNQLTTVFRPGQKSTVFPAAPAGLLYAGDPGVPTGGTPSDWNNFGPRVGFAWSPFGSRKTSVRAAYGIFFDTPRFHEISQYIGSPPYSLQTTVNAPRSFSDPYAGMVNPFPYTPPQTDQERAAYKFLLPVTIGQSVPTSFPTSYNQQWNFNIQREIVGGLVLTAAYVGTKGTHLPIRTELNPAIYAPGATAANINSRRLYGTNFASITELEDVINSSYNALQLSLNKRFSHGFTVLASYTYGKSLDGISLETDAYNGQNPLNLRGDRGLSDFDIRQRFVGSFLYELPSPKSGIARWVAGGWQLNGILTAQTGGVYTIVSGTDRVFSGTGTQRPDAVGDPNLDTGRPTDQLLAMYFNPKAFTLPALGNYGNTGRNTMIGPGRWNLDSALFKRFPIREGMRLEFRWEFFNFFNHANFGNPVANISSNTVGRITSASAGRIMQLGLRLVF
jgi:Carboxypeptidase regulatory-like domain/TonB-dependent Receptor Plug Domain